MLPLMASNMWQASEEAAIEVIRTDRNNYYANSRLAYIFFSQKRYVEAEKLYRKVLSWYPSDIEMKLGLAWTLFFMGNMEEAARYFGEVLKVLRKHPGALQGMETIRKYR
jgi:tetratricopeptide (TPR) repeat protein